MNRSTFAFLSTVALLAGATHVAATEKFTVDTGHSFLGFTVKHMAVASVRGEFKDFTADLTVDEADLANSSIVLTIQAASIDTREEDRDEHLRGEDFFEVKSFPEIVFRSRKIERVEGNRYLATGDLTLKGTTREVVLDLEINGPVKDPWGNYRVGAEGGVTIDRQDFGVNYSRLMDNGGLVVSDDVKISFSLEAKRKGA